ncbi:MAG: hypothetical protein AB2531_03345 [Candidatus Thiodiazotropha sp.]|uniref:Uncharacterized protein n=1 Tax=Candidatus Thiodiazotropha taylori TaxID=2792791 RepID=A0A944M6H1_9GAMM|nr:hypothetical protein [Candidatus Thiodiazotropha taylori]
MKFKEKVWKYATVIVVLLVLLNPEMAELALFIDAVGLEMFLMLLEVQIVVMFSLFFNTTIKSAYIYVKNLFLKLLPILSWESIKENPGNLILVVPSPAILMNVMVVSTLLGIALFTK